MRSTGGCCLSSISNKYNNKMKDKRRSYCSADSQVNYRFDSPSYTARQPEFSSGEQRCHLRNILNRQKARKEFRGALQLKNKQNGVSSEENSQREEPINLKKCLKELKVVKIQNEYLINVIQNNQANLILRKEIQQLKQLQKAMVEKNKNQGSQLSTLIIQLKDTEKQLYSWHQQQSVLQKNNQSLINQNARLMHLLKEKQQRVGTKPTLITQKASLCKIRSQYQESLKMAIDSNLIETRKMEEKYKEGFSRLSKKLQIVSQKLRQVENSRKQKVSSKQQDQKKQPDLQIQFLLQKYYQTEQSLQKQRRVNFKLSSQLCELQKTLREIQINSLEGHSLFQTIKSISKEEMIRQKGEQVSGCNCQVRWQQQKKKREYDRQDNEAKMKTIVSCYQNQLIEKQREVRSKRQEIDVLYKNTQTVIEHYQTKIKETKQKVQPLFYNSRVKESLDLDISQVTSGGNPTERFQLTDKQYSASKMNLITKKGKECTDQWIKCVQQGQRQLGVLKGCIEKRPSNSRNRRFEQQKWV